MKRIGWSRVCVYALIYFVTGVAASGAVSYWFSRFGPEVGHSMVVVGWTASAIVAALVSMALALRRPSQSFLHAALAYLFCELLASAFLSALLETSAAPGVRAIESATILVAICIGTALGRRLHGARPASGAASFAGEV